MAVMREPFSNCISLFEREASEACSISVYFGSTMCTAFWNASTQKRALRIHSSACRSPAESTTQCCPGRRNTQSTTASHAVAKLLPVWRDHMPIL